jgi:hypothetical protein
MGGASRLFCGSTVGKAQRAHQKSFNEIRSRNGDDSAKAPFATYKKTTY